MKTSSSTIYIDERFKSRLNLKAQSFRTNVIIGHRRSTDMVEPQADPITHTTVKINEVWHESKKSIVEVEIEEEKKSRCVIL